MNEDVVLQEIDKLMDNFANRVFQISQEKLVNDGKIDTGTLMKTANVERSFLRKKIVYPAKYASDVEFGRTAGTMPPVEPLQKWARRKLGVDEKKAKGLGWAIAVTIKKRGVLPSPFLQPAIEQAKAEFGL